MYVLLIEDDPSIADTMVLYLETKHIRCQRGCRYEDAVVAVRAFGPPTLALIDYVGCDADSIIRLLKRYNTRMIMITALAICPVDLQVIYKPFSLEAIDEALKEAGLLDTP